MKTENLINEEAVKKMQTIVEGNEVCMLLTDLNKQPIDVNPMQTKSVKDDGTFWFLSPLNSAHNMNIQVNNNVQLLYSDTNNNSYLSVYGKATIETHHNMLKEFYTSEDNNWFDGVDDPNLTAIKVIPKEAYYWDKSQNKFMSIIENSVEAVTGKKNNDFTKGKMKME